MLMFVSLLIGNGCRKDEFILDQISPSLPLKNFKTWNDKQTKFFNLSNTTAAKRESLQNSLQNRNSTGFNVADSTFMRIYNKMVDIDQESNLVDKISDVVGFPIWQNIVIYENQTEKSSTFYLPLGFEYGNKTEAIISGIEYEQNGVRMYSFKLTERSEIQEVFSDESKLATYNNFAMEAIYFVYSDFYIFHANYEQFSSKIIEMY